MTAFRMLLAVFASRVLIALLGAVSLLAMADMAETSRQLAEQEDPLRLLLAVYGNLIPSLTIQALPIAVLLGVLLAVTDLARSRELLALRAAGASTFRLALPALSIAALLSFAGLIIADHVAPLGVERATRIQMEELGRMRASWSPFHGRLSWFATSGGGLYNVAEVSSGGRDLLEFWRYEHQGGRMTEISFAERLVHDGESWVPQGSPRVWTLDPSDGSTLRIHDQLAPVEEPIRFAGVGAHPEALTRRALRSAIELRRAQGQPSLPFELEAQSRSTMPLLGLALSMIALGIGLRRPPTTHVEAAGLAMAIAFSAWTLLAACRAMGHAGMLGPMLSALLPVLLTGAVGLTLLISRP